ANQAGGWAHKTDRSAALDSLGSTSNRPAGMSILNTELWKLGDSTVTVSSLLTAIAIFIAALTVAWVFKRFIERMRKHSKAAGASAIYLAGQAGRYLIVFIGLLLAGSAMGVNLSSLSLF